MPSLSGLIYIIEKKNDENNIIYEERKTDDCKKAPMPLPVMHSIHKIPNA